MAVAVAGGGQEPDYIKYLMDPNKEYDCYFIVTNPESEMNEKIGGVKKMLMAHSEVLRTELEESQLAMKTDIRVCDLFSDTLRQLLKYIYGYDVTASMCFDDADNLLYAAEKYMITSLKDKLVFRLMNLVTSDNVCSLLNNPVCYKPLQLKNTISKILQYETDKVLQNPQFLHLSSEAFLKILEQDAMNVPEIEVWRAAVKWAKHKAASEEGELLRQKLDSHVKYIRFCTLTAEELRNEVTPTCILSDAEIKQVSSSKNLFKFLHGKHPRSSMEICDNKEKRNQNNRVKSGIYKAKFFEDQRILWSSRSIVNVTTKDHGIELLPLVFKAGTHKAAEEEYTMDCSIKISLFRENTSNFEPAVSLNNCQRLKGVEEFVVPLVHNGVNVALEPNKKYSIRMDFSEYCWTWKVSPNFDNEHVTVSFDLDENKISYQCFCPLTGLEYLTV